MIGLPTLATVAAENLLQSLLGLGGQSFTTVPVPNRRKAIYSLSIRAPGQAKSAVMSYTFPITPSSIGKEYTALTNTYNVAGSPRQKGVSRNADEYGNTPPTYLIDGTTGWQLHSADGYGLTGIQSIAQIQELLGLYEQLNQGQAANGISDLYTLEFYDYFADEYWQVVPVGRQGISQDANKPLYFRYSFRWDAIKAVSDPPPPKTADPILAAFQIAAPTALSTLAISVAIPLAQYSSQTGGALLASIGA